MIYVLVWLLVGSLSLNYLWIKKDKRVMEEFNPKPNNINYLNGLLLGSFGGPLTIAIKYFVDYLEQKEYKRRYDDLEAAVARKRGMAQIVKKTRLEYHPDGVKEVVCNTK